MLNYMRKLKVTAIVLIVYAATAVPIASVLSFTPAMYGQREVPASNVDNVIVAQHSQMMRDIGSIQQHLLDIEKRLDIHRVQIDAAIQPSTAEAERIVHLEEFVSLHTKAEANAAAASAKRWSDVESWGKIIFGFLLTLIGNEIWKRYWDSHRQQKKDIVVAEKIHTLGESFDTLAVQTNNKMDHLLRVTEQVKSKIKSDSVDDAFAEEARATAELVEMEEEEDEPHEKG